MNFVTIDVETANNNVGSICQIGLAKYIKGKLVDTYCSLVQPQGSFNQRNIEVHGITSQMVKNAPTIYDIYGSILQFIGTNVVVSYTDFDQRAIKKCLEEHNLPLPEWLWADASIMVRETCSRFEHKGYNLANVCKEWNYQFNHHDALEDAKACGHISVTILRENNFSINDWVNKGKSKRRSFNNNNAKTYPVSRSKEGDENGRYAGLNICFTGNLSISRIEIVEIAAKHGFNVKASASKKLDYLVVGVADLSLLAGYDKSSKQRKVEQLIAEGINIKIIEEKEFLKLIKI